MTTAPEPGDRVEWVVHGGATVRGTVKSIDGEMAIVRGDGWSYDSRVTWRRMALALRQED